jgi:site-specific DNA-methyltransferase (adenine-specific)
MSDIRIVHGDALQRLRDQADASVDLLIADPPYNLGKDYGDESDCRTFDEYLTFSKDWLVEANRVLKKGGTIYVFMGVRFVSYLYSIIERDLGLDFNSWITWHYTQGIGRKRGFSPRHDDVLMFTKGTQYKYNLDAIRVPQKYYRQRNNMRGANPGDVWLFSHVHYCNENRLQHPTQKPEGIIERMVLASSDPGDTVLDPFSGSGTTARVCQQLARSCIAIESNDDYIAMIRKRLKTHFAGFDSIDPRMSRVPLDMNDAEFRKSYLKNHVEWFLRKHENSFDQFADAVIDAYGEAALVDAFGDRFKRRGKLDPYAKRSFEEHLKLL